MSPTVEFIHRLVSLKEGELSQLRRLAGQPLDATLAGFDLFTGIWWPLRSKSPKAPRRQAGWLVCKLYACTRVPHLRMETDQGPAFAATLGLCEPCDDHARQRFRSRVDAMICAPLSAIEPHLQWGLRQIAMAVAGRIPHAGGVKGIDWSLLLDDLSIWDRGKENDRRSDIRHEWAEQYLKNAHA